MPTSKTVSSCTPDLEEGTHLFQILGYSKHRGMGNKFIRSGTFSVAGHDWTILFYPDGSRTGDLDYISVYLELMSQGSKVRASCDLRLVDRSTGLSSSVHWTGPRMFNSSDDSKYAPQTRLSKKRSELESSAYLQDDRLTIECIVTVFKEPHVSKTEFFSEIEVPQSDIMEHLGMLLEEKEGADVTFSVEGETVVAHKIMLAMRSPVFKAEFFGPMREARAQQVTIEDMQPAVFRALLHFIYTDSLPGTDSIWGAAADNEMIRHLLVAADRYAVDRLKVICQSILCRNLDVETVATTMALAYQHNCDRLKDVCLEFITRSNVMDAVVATQGYKNLKATCPSALVDAFEKISMFRKT